MSSLRDASSPAPYTLSLHDALPIYCSGRNSLGSVPRRRCDSGAQSGVDGRRNRTFEDRKSTRLNSSHVSISYAVFCLKKKNLEVETKDGTAPPQRVPLSPHAADCCP